MNTNSSDIKSKVSNLIVENSSLMVFCLNSEGKALFVNPACEKITGYNEKELINNYIWEILCPGDLKYQAEKFMTESSNEELKHFELVLRNKKDEVITIELGTINEFNKNNELEYIYCYAKDITNRKSSVDKLEEIKNELHTKNEELDSFAHTVAHDLKNPLGVLLGFTDILYKEIENLSSDQLHEVLKGIKNTGFKMRNIIKELLLLSEVRREEITLEPIDISNTLAEALLRIDDMIERRNAEISFSKNLPEAYGYAPWIEEVWVNYISNAIKHGAQMPQIEIGYDEVENNRVKFWVKDNGNGIEKAEQKNLFVPFTRLQVVRAEGQGLGLSVVSTIIEKLKGEAGVDSEPGKGSKFYFILNKK